MSIVALILGLRRIDGVGVVEMNLVSRMVGNESIVEGGSPAFWLENFEIGIYLGRARLVYLDLTVRTSH
jgi:hypothetical protein